MIFCDMSNDVDDIHEYLVLKGLKAIGLHGGKSQHEREHNIKKFKEEDVDILVATDIAS